jgi:hypothetical protein
MVQDVHVWSDAMKRYELLVLRCTLEQLEALLFSFRAWKPATGEKLKIKRIEWSKDLKVPERHAMWEVFTYEDSDLYVGGIKIKGTGLVEATEFGNDRTQVQFQDGKSPIGEHMLVGKAFDLLYEALLEQYRNSGLLIEPNVSAKIVTESSDTQDSGTLVATPVKQPQNEVFLPDPTRMRELFPDYNPETARQIAEKLPKMYEAYQRGSLQGRWGPTLIAKQIGYDRATVSRYLNAFRKLGLSELNGVPIASQSEE